MVSAAGSSHRPRVTGGNTRVGEGTRASWSSGTGGRKVSHVDTAHPFCVLSFLLGHCLW